MIEHVQLIQLFSGIYINRVDLSDILINSGY